MVALPSSYLWLSQITGEEVIINRIEDQVVEWEDKLPIDNSLPPLSQPLILPELMKAFKISPEPLPRTPSPPFVLLLLMHYDHKRYPNSFFNFNRFIDDKNGTEEGEARVDPAVSQAFRGGGCPFGIEKHDAKVDYVIDECGGIDSRKCSELFCRSIAPPHSFNESSNSGAVGSGPSGLKNGNSSSSDDKENCVDMPIPMLYPPPSLQILSMQTMGIG
ncbi:Hypothetical predicted protein [Olea europaea subsp. europaea]|uniref:Uncharacterized protein n=1 Tax=Olea europaea subsp. europaea TaxID=158383 RepID=A0A8S0U4L6_OLEEU|nr:Hypothetical predicted protein [Olea europaea subsp. europaea]